MWGSGKVLPALIQSAINFQRTFLNFPIMSGGKYGDIFEGSGLDYVHERRTDAPFLIETALNANAKFLPFYNTHPLFMVEKLGTRIVSRPCHHSGLPLAVEFCNSLWAHFPPQVLAFHPAMGS